MPECELVQNKARVEKKRENRAQKRKIVAHINAHFAQNATMSHLAEAESQASYRRKRLALSYERPTTPQRRKSHSPNENNMAWDINAAILELQNFPPNEKINWSQMARKYKIPHKNAGQVLKETAISHGVDSSSLEQNCNTTPRIRRHKCRVSGGEISMPCLPTVSTIREEQKQLILSGELNIGEPCAPFHLTKSVVTNEGDVEFHDVEINGRKIPLHDIRIELLRKHEKYMRLQTNEQISCMSREGIVSAITSIYHEPSPNASLVDLQATLQRMRTLAMWHDHSTILQTGYILFAVWVVYDPAMFYSQAEWQQQQTGQSGANIQSLVEEPVIYMIAPSSSSPADQLALVGDRIECLQELSRPVTASNGVGVKDTLRFFCGDKPAQQFERGTQIGGIYKCGVCGCKDTMMMDLGHAFHHTWRSLSDIQTLVLGGKFGNKPECLKPFDSLKVADLRKELQARGIHTQGMLKPQLLSTLTDILQGAQRVPTLLTLHPTQSLSSLNLSKYEVLDCEPLHDLKGHLYNLLPEIPHLLPPPLNSECQQILDTTLPKQKVSGALLRVAAAKMLVKLQNSNIDELLLALLNTIVRVSELLYSFDQKRTPKTILQLYNVTWFHHELCCHFLTNAKHQSRSHLFGIYLHDLVAHAPPIYQLVCLRSLNAENQERLFSQAKHISMKATSRKPDNVLPKILL